MAMALFAMGRGARAKKDADDDKSAEKKKTMGALRVQVDFDELELPSNCQLDLPNKDDLLNFKIKVKPDDGMWQRGTFEFSFSIPENYPHKPPKVKCLTKIYHPNIDLDGNVCLNILRDDWKPIFTVQSVLHGLLFLFVEPNHSDPLNHEAAKVMRTDFPQFERNVKASLEGRRVGWGPV
eukprot:GABV01002411.1.p1 GENE.GABV01002411.1~~GABV01002411.1.p1  ORF type:complete len:180 (-),score=39.12 GABV01002411.1:58-597(-)